MASLTCPACGSPMEAHEEPDITVDVCQECGGLFLDRDELNVLSTGMAGDIEYCSLEGEPPEDAFPTRTCPRCGDREMEKVNLLRLSEIVFDRCPGCGGYFLDRGELAAANLQLREMSDGEAELREYRDRHLVRVDRVSDLRMEGVPGLAERASPVVSFRASVYFEEPLDLGLRVVPEGWSVKLAKTFGLFSEEDVETGDPAFDGAFVVRARRPGAVREALWEEVREDLLALARGAHALAGGGTRLEVDDERILYTEGPYSDAPDVDLESDAGELLDTMVRAARGIERGLPA